jgi:hypothetical protein
MSLANYPADLADRLFAFETGELDEEETLQFFADLLTSAQTSKPRSLAA